MRKIKNITRIVILFFMVSVFCIGVVAEESKTIDYAADPAGWGDWSDVDFTNPALYANTRVYVHAEFSQRFHEVPVSLYGLVRFDRLKYDQLPYAVLSGAFYQNEEFVKNIKQVPAQAYRQVKWDWVDFLEIKFKEVTWGQELPRSFHETLAAKTQVVRNYCAQQGGGSCAGISIDRDAIKSAEFTGEGMRIGDSAVTLTRYPRGTSFVVLPDRIVVRLHKGQNLNAGILGGDRFRLEMAQEQIIEVKDSAGMRSRRAHGVLDFDGEHWSVPAGSTVTINAVDVVNVAKDTIIFGIGNSKDDQEYLRLEREQKLDQFYESFYPDMQDRFKGKNVIILGNQQIFAVGAHCPECNALIETVTLDFKPNNPYITIDEGSGSVYHQQTVPDKLTITPINGGSIWNGAGQLTVAGLVRMQNGQNKITYNNGAVYTNTILNKPTIEYGSVPMTIKVLNEHYNNPYEGQTKTEVMIGNDNDISYGDQVNYFSVLVDPHHLLKGRKETFELLNKIKNDKFTTPVVVVTMPPKSEDEQEYFDAAARLFEINMKMPLLLRLENGENSQTHQENMAAYQLLLQNLNQQIGSGFETVIIGHSELETNLQTGKKIVLLPTGFKKQEGKTMPENKEIINNPDIVIGSSIGQMKIENIYETLRKEGILNFLKEDEDYFITIDEKGKEHFTLTDKGEKVIWPLVRQRLDEDKTTKILYEILHDENGYIKHSPTIDPRTTPLFAAIKVSLLKYPYLKEQFKDASDPLLGILLSPEMQTITFHSCKYAREVEQRVYLITRRLIKYDNCI